jgi:hypothetical protein
MLVQAPAMQIRIPVRMPGSAARICTRAMVWRGDAPSVRAHSLRSSGTSSSAATVVTAMIGITPIMMRTSLGISPIPSQMMNSGMNASGGSGLSTSMTGSIRCRTTRLADMAAPRPTPIAVPAVKPIRIRRRLVSASNHSGLPCAG